MPVASSTSRGKQAPRKRAKKKTSLKGPISYLDERAKLIYGCEEPRVWTKPLRKLTRETSLGFLAIDFAEEMLGLHLLPWQKWLLVHMFELNKDGTLRFRTVIVCVARQNGKSTIAQVICLFRLLVEKTKLVLGTAQSLDIAREVWKDAVSLLENSPLCTEICKVMESNGKEELRLFSDPLNHSQKNTARWKVAAANRKGGRGLSVDTVLMDELREQQTWDAWEAIANTTMARINGLVIGISNAGDESSVVLKEQRARATAEIDEGTQMGVFEWSAPDECDLDDVKAWAQANPSLGYTLPLAALIDARGGRESSFRTENLCQWVTADVETYLDVEQWRLLEDAASQVDAGRDICVGIDVSADRRWSAVSVAGYREDGLFHVETVAYREGMFWVINYLKELLEALDLEEVVLQERGCAAAELIAPLEAEGIKVRKLRGSELGFATGQFSDRVRDRGLYHLGQPAMNLAVAGALTRKLGEAQGWDRNASRSDIAPLVAASWALYALVNPVEEEAETSAYSSMESDWWRDAREATRAELARVKEEDWWR